MAALSSVRSPQCQCASTTYTQVLFEIGHHSNQFGQRMRLAIKVPAHPLSVTGTRKFVPWETWSLWWPATLKVYISVWCDDTRQQCYVRVTWTKSVEWYLSVCKHDKVCLPWALTCRSCLRKKLQDKMTCRSCTPSQLNLAPIFREGTPETTKLRRGLCVEN